MLRGRIVQSQGYKHESLTVKESNVNMCACDWCTREEANLRRSVTSNPRNLALGLSTIMHSCTLHSLSLSLSHTHTHTKICFMQRLYRIQHPCIQLLHFTHTDTHTHTQCLEFGVTAPHSHILQNDLSPRLFLYLLIHRCKSHKVL